MIWENTLSGMVDSTASRFDESTQYKKSDYVWYAATGVKPKLYKAKADMAAGAWDASKWEAISTTREFVSKDLIHSRHKNIKEDFEVSGNKFGYKKFESWYEVRPASDDSAVYHNGDVVYVIEPWDNVFCTMVCHEEDPGQDMTLQDIINAGWSALEWDWDNDTVKEVEGFTPVEGELYSCRDNDWKYAFYKYSGGTYTKLEPLVKNLDDVKAAGFHTGDWFVSTEGEYVKIFKLTTDDPAYEFVEADVFDVAMCQSEYAKKLEDIDPGDYYYGMPFYKDYQLYALLSNTPAYEDIMVEGTVDHDVLEVERFGNVYGVKLNSINDIHQIFTGNKYRATQALIFNIFDGRFDLPVPGFKSDGNYYCVNIVGSPITDYNTYVDNEPGMIIKVLGNQSAYYDVYWDMMESSYDIFVAGFSQVPDAGDTPPAVRVNICRIMNSSMFFIYDDTVSPYGEDDPIRMCHAGLGYIMQFERSVVYVVTSHKKGICVPLGYRFVDCEVTLSGGDDTGKHAVEFSLAAATELTIPFWIENSDIFIQAEDTLEFDSLTLKGLNSRFYINANNVIFDDHIEVFNMMNCMVLIRASESLTLKNAASHDGMFELNETVKNNDIVMITKWNSAHKDIPLWFSTDGVYRGDGINGAFDNKFVFVHSDGTNLTECPFGMNDFRSLVHSGNRIYADRYNSGLLVWHDYPTA